MPLYDYRCPECGATREDALEPLNAIKPICHSCGESEMERMPSRTTWHFKGEGE